MPNFERILKLAEDAEALGNEIKIVTKGAEVVGDALHDVRMAPSGERAVGQTATASGRLILPGGLSMRSEIHVPGFESGKPTSLGIKLDPEGDGHLLLTPLKDYPKMPPEVIDWDRGRRAPRNDGENRPGLQIPVPDRRTPPPGWREDGKLIEEPSEDGSFTFPMTKNAMNGDGATFPVSNLANTARAVEANTFDVLRSQFGEHSVLKNDPAKGYVKVQIFEPPKNNPERISAGSIYEVFNNGDQPTKHGWVHSIETKPDGEIVYRNKDAADPSRQFAAWDFAPGKESSRTIGGHEARFVSGKVFPDGRSVLTEADGSTLFQGSDGVNEVFKPVGAIQIRQNDQRMMKIGAVYRRLDGDVVYMGTDNKEILVRPNARGDSLVVSGADPNDYNVVQIRETYQAKAGFQGYPAGIGAANDVYVTAQRTRYVLPNTVADVPLRPYQEPFGIVLRTVNVRGVNAFRDPRHILLTEDGGYLSYVQFGKPRINLDAPFEASPRYVDNMSVRGYWENANQEKKYDPW